MSPSFKDSSAILSSECRSLDLGMSHLHYSYLPSDIPLVSTTRQSGRSSRLDFHFHATSCCDAATTLDLDSIYGFVAVTKVDVQGGVKK